MANSKITDLGAASALAGADLFEVVQGGTNKKATATQVQTFAVSSLAASATTDTTNATNISSGTLANARLPTAISVTNLDGILGANTPAAATVTALTNSGAQINSAAGAASVPSLLFSGTLFTGGSGTTTFPQMLIQATGTTAVTTYNTAGSYLVVNAVSAFAGNFLDFHTAGGVTLFRIDSAGVSRSTGVVNSGIITSTGGTINLNVSSNAAINLATGTTNQAVTIGNSANTVVIGAPITLAGGTLLTTSAALTNNAAAQLATLTNGPTAGNPTKWIPVNDNGTTRNVPAW